MALSTRLANRPIENRDTQKRSRPRGNRGVNNIKSKLPACAQIVTRHERHWRDKARERERCYFNDRSRRLQKRWRRATALATVAAMGAWGPGPYSATEAARALNNEDIYDDQPSFGLTATRPPSKAVE